MKSLICVLVSLVAMNVAGPLFAQDTELKTETGEQAVPAALGFTMKSIDGDDIDLSQYRGKVVMIVNVASRCGMTPQYEQLQALYSELGDKGLVVLGFPCNQFGAQEPGSEADIKEFCSTKYDVTFPMFAKVDVNGDDRCELYEHLTSLDLQPKGAGNIGWNFEKIILDREGNPIARFGSRTKPDAEEVMKVINDALGAQPRS
ncbi:MAG: glutathione peroxidase [Pirellulaceae bacterium]